MIKTAEQYFDTEFVTENISDLKHIQIKYAMNFAREYAKYFNRQMKVTGVVSEILFGIAEEGNKLYVFKSFENAEKKIIDINKLYDVDLEVVKIIVRD